MVWQRRYGSFHGNLEVIQALPDGSYALCGYQRTSPNQTQLLTGNGWLLRINLAGDTLSSRYFGQQVSDEYLHDVTPTPDGGLQLCGEYVPQANTGQPAQGWLLRLDSLGNELWRHYLPNPAAGKSSLFLRNWVLQDGKVLVSGARDPAVVNVTRLRGYVAAWQPPTTGAPPVLAWETSYGPLSSNAGTNSLLDPNGDLTVYHSYNPPIVGASGRDIGLTRFTNVGQPYVPDLCRTPPVARATFATPAPDSLVAQATAAGAGPRHAQLVAWHWDFGDGSPGASTATARHRYAPGVARPGLRVTLTVTNNLGCAHTESFFPFGTLATRSPLTEAIDVFPNPTAGAATVRLAGRYAGPAIRLSLYDALGRQLQQMPALGGTGAAGVREVPLRLQALPAGLYWLRLEVPGQPPALRRLLKQ
ncbi:PKD domain-containing protein [Hymenobacter psychrotolerans]|uniref:PKD domain-containing protein n=1 Tax=Hymenobacter psychrotolerans TaxID=344998 RepID=UPI00093466FF|nr:PKD domain-containing protein [Hymenobacter psychrotolerans]